MQHVVRLERQAVSSKKEAEGVEAKYRLAIEQQVCFSPLLPIILRNSFFLGSTAGS